MLGFLLWVGNGERQDFRFVVSARPGGTQLFDLLFRVLGALCARLRAGSDSPGDTSGAAPGMSQVFKRRLPTWAGCDFGTDGVGRRSEILPLVGMVMESALGGLSRQC